MARSGAAIFSAYGSNINLCGDNVFEKPADVGGAISIFDSAVFLLGLLTTSIQQKEEVQCLCYFNIEYGAKLKPYYISQPCLCSLYITYYRDAVTIEQCEFSMNLSLVLPFNNLIDPVSTALLRCFLNLIDLNGDTFSSTQ